MNIQTNLFLSFLLLILSLVSACEKKDEAAQSSEDKAAQSSEAAGAAAPISEKASSTDAAATVADTAASDQTINIKFFVNKDSTSSRYISAGASSSLSRIAMPNLTDISRMVVTVKDENTVLIEAQKMSYTDKVWSTQLEKLPVKVLLTFQTFAYDNSDKEVYSGTVIKVLSGDSGADNEVKVTLGINTMTTSLLSIKSIQLPREFLINSKSTVQADIEGAAGKTLNYKLKAVADGGEFTPATLNIVPTNSGQVNVNASYQAPATPGTYSHSLTIINADNFSVKTNFSTKVVTTAPQQGLRRFFNPWLLAYSVGPRVANQLYLTIEVADNYPVEQLKYQWSFEGDVPGSLPTVSFKNATVQNPILDNYSENVAGVIRLLITDQEGGTTEVSYSLKKGAFPDCAGNCILPTAVAGVDQAVFLGERVALDGSGSKDSNNQSLSYQWQLLTKPTGSTASLNSPKTATPNFIPDVTGNYVVSLSVSNGLNTSVDTIIITVKAPAAVQAKPTAETKTEIKTGTETAKVLPVAEKPIEKPTLHIKPSADGSYEMVLLSPLTLQNEKLVSVSNVGIQCDKFSLIKGSSGYTPDYKSFNNKHTISFVDLSAIKKTASASLALYAFRCTATPSLILGAAVAITYTNTGIFTGTNKVAAQ